MDLYNLLLFALGLFIGYRFYIVKNIQWPGAMTMIRNRILEDEKKKNDRKS